MSVCIVTDTFGTGLWAAQPDLAGYRWKERGKEDNEGRQDMEGEWKGREQGVGRASLSHFGRGLCVYCWSSCHAMRLMELSESCAATCWLTRAHRDVNTNVVRHNYMSLSPRSRAPHDLKDLTFRPYCGFYFYPRLYGWRGQGRMYSQWRPGAPSPNIEIIFRLYKFRLFSSDVHSVTTLSWCFSFSRPPPPPVKVRYRSGHCL